jgi:hypothetical protein
MLRGHDLGATVASGRDWSRTLWVALELVGDGADGRRDELGRGALLLDAYTGHAEAVAASIKLQSCR